MSIDNLKTRYEAKKQSCVARMIPFELTYEEWVVLHELKNTLTCAYTNVPCSNKKGRHGENNNASLERIKDDIGYVKENLVYVTVHANNLKNDYIFLNKPTKGLSTQDIGYCHRIKKIINDENNLKVVMKPYTEAFATLNNSLQLKQKQLAKENALNMEQQKENRRYTDEIKFAKHYSQLAEEFNSIGVPLQITLGEMKKKMQCKRDQITGKPFTNINEKRVFVVDKSVKVDKHNIRVVHASTQSTLDSLLNCGDSGKIISSLKKMF